MCCGTVSMHTYISGGKTPGKNYLVYTREGDDEQASYRLYNLKKKYKKAMIRKWRNQKEIPTPQTEGLEKTKMTLRYIVLIRRIHIVSRVSSYSSICGHSVT